jgi:hypothetical protein
MNVTSGSRLNHLNPVISIFAGFLANWLMPHASFGTYDIAIRAAVTGAVTAVAGFLILAFNKRRT